MALLDTADTGLTGLGATRPSIFGPGKRVLIMSASAGTGHGRAAEALRLAFASDARVAQVTHTDALRFTNRLFRDFYSALYTKLVRHAPDFLGWWYKNTDEPWKTDRVRLALDRVNSGPLVKFIQRFDPEIIVCTHFMPAGIISHLIAHHQLQARLAIVVTDLDFHALWLSRVFHRYFVAIEETRAYLEALGLPSDRITVSGIPIDPGFLMPLDRAQAREAYGLASDVPTLLLSAGALGVTPAEFIVQRLLQLRHKTQTIVLCGRNEDLRARIATLVEGNPAFLVMGYSDRMHELMRIADLFIGKPGGLTTAESLASGLPMIIVSPIPGQEERNSDHLLEDGVAMRCNELITLPFRVDRLLDDPARLKAMRVQAIRLGRPHAARDIARTLIEDDLPAVQIDAAGCEAIANAASTSSVSA